MLDQLLILQSENKIINHIVVMKAINLIILKYLKLLEQTGTGRAGI